MATIFMFVSQAYNLAAPTLIQQITRYVSDPTMPTWQGYFFVALLGIGQWFGIGVCQSHSFLLMYEIGINARSALTGFVYRKSTNLNNQARQKLTVGEIVNLMSNDTQRYVEVTQFLQQIWSGPFVIVVGLVLLIRLIGVAALAGLVLMIVTIPLQGKMFSWSGKLRREVMIQSDVRIKLMNEILQGIKVIKLYAWESSFLEKIRLVRSAEVKGILQTAILRGLNFGLFSALPSIIAIVSLVIYSARGNALTADIVFPAIAYLNVLRFPLLFLPMLVTQLAQLKISTKRLSALFEAGELDESVHDWEMQAGAGEAGGRVEVANGTFKWIDDDSETAVDTIKKPLKDKKSRRRFLLFGKRKDDSSENTASSSEPNSSDAAGESSEEVHTIFELSNIDFKAEPGEFVVIVGSVGSGKSSLISAILGEMTKIAGSVNIRGSIAYVAQTAWIFNNTLRNNILFNRPLDEKKYSKTVYTTSLESDIEILPGGDETEIGEKGINLSGGQKQRVSIARAVYSDSDIYILDDPLSAVDSHVGKHIFTECFSKQLRKKTRILVTNQMQYLPYADRIYVFKSGRIQEVGTFEELNREGTVLHGIMQVFGSNVQAHVTKYDTEYSETEKQKEKAEAKELEKEKEVERHGSLVTAEVRQSGGISKQIWFDYFRAGGGVLVGFLIIGIYMLTQVSNMAPDIWLTNWTNQFTSDPAGTQSRLGYYAGIYGALGGALGILGVARSTIFAVFSTKAAKSLHNSMLSTVIRAPMGFFDVTPLGRILNRFSKDTDTTDILLPPVMDNQFFLILNMIGVYVLIAVYLPWFLIAVPVIFGMYFTVQYYYRRTSRELQRIENVQRSPIYAHFSESLSGVSTIRAYGRMEEAREENWFKQDSANTAYYLLQVAMRWLQFRLELVSLLILLFIGFLIVASRGTGLIGLNASQAGLLLTYTLSVTSVTTFMVRSSVELETKLTSVERMVEYGRDIETEAAPIVDDYRPPDNWPSVGKIEFNDVSLRYRPGLDLVLKDVNFEVDPLWKVGIAGRTGSGKSSLAVALFRLVEKAGGSVIIDGIDTSKIGLDDLRSRICMIPQDPVVFSGTVRFNVDPFSQKSDAEIWDALDHVQLRNVISNLEGKYESTSKLVHLS